MSEPETKPPGPYPWPVVAFAGWILPGLGHALVGELRRGIIIGVTLVGLFCGGLWIGGVDAIDSREDFLWFVGQAVFGPPTLVIDATHRGWDYQEQFLENPSADRKPDRYRAPDPEDGLAYEPSLGRVNELGTLYCTLAGVLNLLVILDATSRQIDATEAQRRRGPKP